MRQARRCTAACVHATHYWYGARLRKQRGRVRRFVHSTAARTTREVVARRALPTARQVGGRVRWRHLTAMRTAGREGAAGTPLARRTTESAQLFGPPGGSAAAPVAGRTAATRRS